MAFLLTGCDPDRLRLLADDRLPPDETISVEAHLEECPQCRETLDGLVGDDHCLEGVRRFLGGDPSEHDERDPIPAESLYFLAPSDWPDSIGRLGTYEVKGILGRGGMGVVVKAFDPALNRNVAIKVLSASLATTGAARSRFLREARAAAAVVHEHVVGVFAVAESAGLPFLVMEYVSGRSLQDRLDRDGPLSVTELLRIGMQTAAGLAAAHAQGLVHRDVKPANILLENSVERVRLTDFGLARAAADAGMSHSGVVAGTPYYMAPEQARGDSTDHRADLFSLGSTLYATCAGHPPFRAETPLAVLRRVSDDQPRPLREINPDVPAWLEALIKRLMAKDPSDRYQTADEALDVLKKCLAHVQQPLTSPLPAGLEPRRRGRGLKKGLAAAAALFLIACVPAGIAIRSRWSFTPDRAQATEGRLEADPFGLDPWRGAPSSDKIQQLIDQGRLMAQQTERDIVHQEEMAGADSISSRGFYLMTEAQALEREIQSGKTAQSDSNASISTPSLLNRR
jgi:serine/threonine protein kinase